MSRRFDVSHLSESEALRRAAAAADWSEVAQVFTGTPALPFVQGWRTQPEPGFRPAAVRLRWEPAALWVYAELGDAHIGNRAETDHEPTWDTGDVFEMMLGSADHERYHELHVTPEGRVLQLAWPDYQVVRALFKSGKTYRDYIDFEKGLFDRWTSIEREAERWRVLARVPATCWGQKKAFEPGCRLRGAFCRYDYGADGRPPVLSATVPFSAINYHAHAEWDEFVLS